MFNHKRFLTTLGAASVLLLAACGAPAGNDAPAGAPPSAPTEQAPAVQQAEQGAAATVAVSAQDTLDMLVLTLANSLDPHVSNDSGSAQINTQIYSRLLGIDYNDFSPLPSLATDWNVVDAQTIEMTLAQGVTFHNGMPLTAYDVQYSLERAAASPAMEPIIGMLSHVEVHDDHNFTIHLAIPYAPILRMLAHVGTSIVSRELSESGHDLSEHPIGTGAFVFENLVIGSSLTLSSNPDYFGGQPLVSTVNFRQVTEPSVRLIEVEAGTADIAIGIAAADLPRAEASTDATLLRRVNLSTNYIGFNTQQGPLADQRVRQAIRYALDTELMWDVVFLGVGQPAHNVMGPNVFGHAPVRRFEPNLDRALELMEEAGFADGFTVEMAFNVETPQRADISTITANMLRDLNIDVEIVGLEWGVYLDHTDSTDHGMFVLGWVALGGDADYALWPNFHSSLIDGGNRVRLNSPELDVLLDTAREETDQNRREALYAEALELINELSVWIPLNHGEELVAVNNNLRGLVLAPGGHHVLSTVYFVD